MHTFACSCMYICCWLAQWAAQNGQAGRAASLLGGSSEGLTVLIQLLTKPCACPAPLLCACALCLHVVPSCCCCCCAPCWFHPPPPSPQTLSQQQYYYETIFPRIPKKVEDDIQAALRGRGLPTKGKGNGGCGGPDRRGGDDGNRRPASVKASLSVAFGQRAPNRAGTRKAAGDGRAGGGGGVGGGGGSLRDRSRDPSREPAADGERRGGGAADRSYAGRSRSGSRERPRDRYNGYDSRDRDRDRERGYDSRDRERDRSARDYDSRRGDR